MGCFWGAERVFWEIEGVYTTAVGYAGGSSPDPTYEEVCSGATGHAEVVRVVFDTKRLSFERLLEFFWQSHDPTQGMRQGPDRGTQYRSIVLCSDTTQLCQAQQSCDHYQQEIRRHRDLKITTEIIMSEAFFFAEPYHQQYLARNPNGYCGLQPLQLK